MLMYFFFLQVFFLESHPYYDQTQDIARVFDFVNNRQCSF
jgi:hypothetical protein